MTRDCCGQSMWLAVVTCQKPTSPSARHTGVTQWRWVWPFTQSTTFRCWSSRARSSSTEHPVMSCRSPVVDHRFQRMVAEQHDEPVGCGGELEAQPGELSRVERTLPAAVGIDGVEHDDPYPLAPVEGVVADLCDHVVVAVAMAGGPSGGGEVGGQMLGSRLQPPFSVGGHRHRGAAEQLIQRVDLRVLQALQHLCRLQGVGRGDELEAAQGNAFEVRGGRDGALQLVVVIAVDGKPGHPQAAGLEGPPGGVEHSFGGREPIATAGDVSCLAGRVPVARITARADTLVSFGVTRIGRDRSAVEQAKKRLQFIVLCIVGEITCHDGEVDGTSRDRPLRDGVGRLHHGLDDLMGEQLLRPVGADGAALARRHEIGIGEAVEQLHPRR